MLLVVEILDVVSPPGSNGLTPILDPPTNPLAKDVEMCGLVRNSCWCIAETKATRRAMIAMILIFIYIRLCFNFQFKIQYSKS